MEREDPDSARATVRERYGRIAEESTGCCGTTGGHAEHSRRIGYSDAEITAAPPGADLGLGCGNPTALALLRPGETVLDLGSGAGFDAFLAARVVGAAGRVIGVDMTSAMIAKAQENARKAGVTNAEFRLGTIEELPIEDASVDVVISNCVINLSPDKPRVFREAFRVLKPGGRLLVSDIVLRTPLPERVLASVEAYVGCVAGAALRSDYLQAITDAGFSQVQVLTETDASALLAADCACAPDPLVADVIAAVGDAEELRRLVAGVASIAVSARKP
ncbi:MAG: arsenite methyltransferase [Candidatus Binatia bacterium]